MSQSISPVVENEQRIHPDQQAIIDQIIAANINRPGATMVVLNEIQSQIGYVSEAMQQYTADQLHVPVSAVHGVISFYSFSFSSRLHSLAGKPGFVLRYGSKSYGTAPDLRRNAAIPSARTRYPSPFGWIGSAFNFLSDRISASNIPSMGTPMSLEILP